MRQAKKAHPKFWHGHRAKKTSRTDHIKKRDSNMNKILKLKKIHKYE